VHDAREVGDNVAMNLADRDCVPCRGKVPPLAPERSSELLGHLDGWRVVDGHHLAKEYRFPDFARALALVNAIGSVAEAQNHHPDLELAWGRVGVKIWTHAIDGLTESDFVLAAKCDRAFGGLAG
jgi:4a-hydroxytetrahydrobiopterin dehydratase